MPLTAYFLSAFVLGGCFSAGFDLKALSEGQLDPNTYADPKHGDNAGMVRLFFIVALPIAKRWGGGG